MPRPLAILLAAALLLATHAAEAQTGCYADYKAKRDNPLRLHYGVIALPDGSCGQRQAAAEATRRLAAQGWTLLNIVSIFGPEGLDARRSDAGEHFLRY